MTDIRLKRAYDEPARSDGPRLLIDRIWPRGVSKEDAKLAAWLKELAPSTELRKWFDHEEDKWDDFQDKYEKELEANNTASLAELKDYLKNHKRITLLYGAKNTECNNAVVLKNYLQNNKL